MRRIHLLFVLLILFSLDMAKCQTKDYKEKLESLYNHTVPLINTVDLSTETKQDSSLVLLDIRSDVEYAVSHLAGARKIDYDDFEKKDVQDIPLDAMIVVYCSIGYRSEKVGEQLLDMGFTNVRNLYGGIFQWKNDGFEVLNQQSFETDSVHTYNKNWSQWLLKGVKVY